MIKKLIVGDLTSKTVLSEKKSIYLIWPLKSYIRSLCTSEKKNFSMMYISSIVIADWTSYESELSFIEMVCI